MMPVNRVLLTGATGFVGAALLAHLQKHANYSVSIASRSEHAELERNCQVFNLGEFGSRTNWRPALTGCDCVIHLAGRAHVLAQESNSLELFREANTRATLNLATQSAAEGVKRFLYVSSIGVNGSYTTDRPFSELSLPEPQADYAVSKFEAEVGLLQLAQETEMEVVIVRPPLVYAAHAPGNFHRLLKLVHSGVPLPFGRVNNSRSMIALENLVDFVAFCIDHPAAANQIFLTSDGINFSTAQMIGLLAKGMQRKGALIPFPVSLLRLFAKVLGKQGMYTQLCGSLQIDSSKARQLLGWTPPVPAEAAMIRAGQEFSDRIVGS